MSDTPTVVKGKLTGAGDFTGYRVSAAFQVPVEGAPDGTTALDRRTAEVAADGSFVLELPDPAKRVEPTTLTVTSPAGVQLEQVELTNAKLADPVELAVTNPPAPTTVETSTDPTLGRAVTYSGRLIDPAGAGAPAGVLVVLWGIPPGGGQGDASPLDVASTSAGGYFFGPWPDDELDKAFAVVAGGDPVEIALDDKRLPTRFAVVVPELPPAPAAEEDDCECDAPPRGADATTLAENSEAFAADPVRCVDFTLPNRTVEEVTYQAVVRTTQPELRGTPPPRPLPLPGKLITKLVELAKSSRVIEAASQPASPTFTRRAALALEAGPAGPTSGLAPQPLGPELITNLIGDPSMQLRLG